jgi:alkanesulfonate monooxygenase SsuD/methylene tetrahydromethanopterin reductase-like flavin-dependent oxidoreductase (luciferase family)
LGIGAGWLESEYLAYGYGSDFPSPLERVKRFEEAIQIIRKMWTGEPVSFHGQYYNVKNVICTPKMKTSPPVMIGTGGEKVMMRLVARYADWWNYSGSPDIEHKLHVLNQHCSAVERNPETLLKTCTTFLALAKTEDKAKEIAARTIYPAMAKTGWSNLILATPDQLVERFQNLVDRGIEYFILRFLDFPKPDGSHLFLDQVLPNLK